MHERGRHIDPSTPIPLPIPRRAGPRNNRLRDRPDTVRHFLAHLHVALRTVPTTGPRRAHQQRGGTVPDADMGDRVHDADLVRVPDGQQCVVGARPRAGLDVSGGGDVVDRDSVDVRDAVLLLRDAGAPAQPAGRADPHIDHHPRCGRGHTRPRGRRRRQLLVRHHRRPGRAHHHHILLRRGRRPHPRPDPLHVPVPPTPRVRLASCGPDTNNLHPRRPHGPDSRSTDPPGLRVDEALRRVQPGHIPDLLDRRTHGSSVPAACTADDGARRHLADPVADGNGRPRMAPRAEVDTGVERHHLPDRHAGHRDPAVRRAHGLALFPRHHRHPHPVPSHRVFHQLLLHTLEDRARRALGCQGRSASQEGVGGEAECLIDNRNLYILFNRC